MEPKAQEQFAKVRNAVNDKLFNLGLIAYAEPFNLDRHVEMCDKDRAEEPGCGQPYTIVDRQLPVSYFGEAQWMFYNATARVHVLWKSSKGEISLIIRMSWQYKGMDSYAGVERHLVTYDYGENWEVRG